ncbi:calcium-translocating P-type ATPase, PMCA-type [Anaerofustis stercorihominis]|uniref:calcium-translocating P-type ATPase, PMCA-type n=1 Tax=Anaerofustis stercorihominis TaxID=214853 RepID=UPI00214C3F07|nr:calcium-translocating P-type ATPase, PMCA-type [Anaerofustis stercorihominis]MCR2032547.1 calcium-translocating P-type ATPase, PMCA-type [Anaerofustis stercorihominis]
MKEYLLSILDVLKNLNTTEDGLTSSEAEEREQSHGKNKLIEGKKISIFKRFINQLLDPMIIILIIAAVVSGITAAYAGESFADVIIIMIVVIINAVLGVVQESKAEKAIDALKEIAAATSKVIRDNKQITIKSEDLVPGDIIILEAGDAVPADGRIIECASMKVEESALTGESVPVTKTENEVKAHANGDVPLGDRKNMVYMGSSVVYGRGKAVITATGMDTEMGKIADALAKAEDNATPLQKKLTQLSKILSILVLGICAIIFAIDIFRVYPNVTGEAMLDTFMVAVSLAVAAIPEGLAAVVTIVLSIGVTNMSKRNAVIRKLTAVETLGCASVICSDKTGTLTQNKMTVVEHYGEDENLIAKGMALCSDAELDENNSAIGEPTECALVNFAYKLNLNKNHLKEEYPRIGEAPFDSLRKMMSTVHKTKEGKIIQFTKGAPDEVLKRCNKALLDGKEVDINEDILNSILTQNKNMADRALRVLCIAMRVWDNEPDSYEANNLEQNLCFVGLTGMIDPVRPEVKDAIVECRNAGIKPIMITGDHRDTAVAIAMELGIIQNKDEAITGAELDEISDEELPNKIEHYAVYARVQPEHKVRIVKAWKDKGKITAMTGDGVNDAPSIKNADIGVGMGITGTDVTKNVADMVLADDNFATIVSAVGEGRRIYDNIRKSIQFLLASNLSEVLSIFIATLLGFTILKPVHLLWINLITDCFPALALGMEKAESDIMKRPPRDSNEGIFAGGMGVNIALQGIMVTVITLLAYFIGHYMESGVWEIVNSADGMTMAFLTLSMAEIFHSFNMRSLDKSIFNIKGQNKYLLLAMLASLICTTAVIYVPFLSSAFGFEHISIMEYAVSILLAVLVIPIVEISKLIKRKSNK